MLESMLKTVKYWFIYIKRRFLDYSLESIIWMVNLGPTYAGFSILKNEYCVYFWVFHFVLIFYQYVLGSLYYLVFDSQSLSDFIHGFVNVSVTVFNIVNSYWFLGHRTLLRETVQIITRNNDLAKSPLTHKKHHCYLLRIKRMLIIFYFCNILDAIFLYYPNRITTTKNFGMTPCVGMSLSSSTHRALCLTMISASELFSSITIMSYQMILLLWFSHTIVMYYLLTEEMSALYIVVKRDRNIFKEKLPSLIERHIVTLKIIDNLKSLYSMPIGINFVMNGIIICLFFYVPQEECFKLVPILVFCLLIFFLYCFICQKLIDAAEDFESAVYACGWEYLDNNGRKTIFIMLKLAQRPLGLSAANIIPLNILTFAKMIQSIFKFVTVVKI